MTGRRRLSEQDSQDGTCQERTARKGLPGQERTSEMGQADETARTGLPKQDGQKTGLS